MNASDEQRDLYEWAARARSVWTTLGNSRAAAEQDSIPTRDVPMPHYNAPTCLNDDESSLVLPAIGGRIALSVELGCRIGTRGEEVRADEAEALIAGYHVLVSVQDDSHLQYALKCSNFPPFGLKDDATRYADYEVSGAWADGFCILSKASVDASGGFPAGAAMRLAVDGKQPIVTNTDEYRHRFPAVIEMIARFVCVDAGDVISLGRAGSDIILEAGETLPEDTALTADVDGVGSMTIPIIDRRSADNYYTRAHEGATAGGFV